MNQNEFREALREMDVSQHQFARDAGIKVSTVNRWATGKINMPALAEAYVRLRLYVHQFKAGRPQGVEEKPRRRAGTVRVVSECPDEREAVAEEAQP